MEVVSTINHTGRAALALTCEHASCAVPAEYDDLGLDLEDLREHIGWDIGAGAVAESLSQRLDAVAVLAGVSRLVIDCNRDLSDHDLILCESHGVPVPGNAGIDAEERRRRIRDFYETYHAAIDTVLAERPRAFLLSLHSFTPELNGRERRFDVGVLFDIHAAEAQQIGAALEREGLRVRYNEPYSGLDGLIFSARSHGLKHGVRYVEVEINNRLLRTPAAIDSVAATLSRVLMPFGAGVFENGDADRPHRPSGFR